MEIVEPEEGWDLHSQPLPRIGCSDAGDSVLLLPSVAGRVGFEDAREKTVKKEGKWTAKRRARYLYKRERKTRMGARVCSNAAARLFRAVPEKLIL